MSLVPHFVSEEVLVTFKFPEDLLTACGRSATVSSEEPDMSRHHTHHGACKEKQVDPPGKW